MKRSDVRVVASEDIVLIPCEANGGGLTNLIFPGTSSGMRQQNRTAMGRCLNANVT